MIWSSRRGGRIPGKVQLINLRGTTAYRVRGRRTLSAVQMAAATRSGG